MHFLESLIAELKASKAAWGERTLSAPIDPDAARPQRHRLVWKPTTSKTARQQETKTINEIQAELPRLMMDYANERKPNRWLIVKPPPGAGKTYASITVAQAFKYRVLFAMPTHKHFETLENFPHFDRSLWYKWLATSATNPEQTDEAMCKETAVTQRLFAKGWGKSLACDGICSLYKHACPYLLQSLVTEKIIAGTWEHITTGLNLNNRKISLAIIDENPTRAILAPKTYTAADLPTGGAGALADVLTAVHTLVSSGGTFSGKTLMTMLRQSLTDLDKIIDADAAMEHDFTVAAPHISNEQDAINAPANIAPVLVPILYNEYQASLQLERWLERIFIADGTLTVYTRNDVWKHLPENVIITDATASPDYYRMLFPEVEFEVYEPQVKRMGRIIQCTANYNGHSTIETSTELWQDMVDDIVLNNPNDRVGVVSFKKVAQNFVAVLGASDVLYYGNQRGSNALEDCDIVIMIGTPSPPDFAIMNTARMLNSERIEPFSTTQLENGFFVPVRSEMERPYNYEENGRQPHRVVSGLWHDTDLKTVMENGRENEMVQALHRARIIRHDATVIILSSVPLSERLDEIHDRLEELFNSPEIPCTPRCGDRCRHLYTDGTRRRIPLNRWLRIKSNLAAAEVGTAVNAQTLAEWSRLVGGEPVTPKNISARGWVSALIAAGVIEKETNPMGKKKRGKPAITGVTR